MAPACGEYGSMDERPGISTGRPVSFIASGHDGFQAYRPSFRNKFVLFFTQLFSYVVSSILLVVVVSWIMVTQLPLLLYKRAKVTEHAWDEPDKWQNERNVNDVKYYAQAVGLDISEEEVETDDEFILRMHRVVNPRHNPNSNGKGGYPVLILHGLFQCSGAFVTSEERSLAFWLSEHGGYQVFLGNTRGVFGMGHKRYSRSDPRFWDWTIRELAMYDFPALVEYVCDVTGYDQIAFIGHSQGNGTAFLSLSVGMRPDIGSRLSVFIALAPAVFAGPLTHGFPFSALSRVDWSTWKVLFGVREFIPLMCQSYHFVPASVYATAGYIMFAYLFSWTDTNWLKRRKTKVFRFTPTPVSSASIFWWCGKGGFAQLKCIMNDSLPQWFEEKFPPLSVYYGGQDYLVSTEPFLKRIRKREKHVKLIRAERIDISEHCDFYLAADAVEWCFSSFLRDIENTRTDTK